MAGRGCTINVSVIGWTSASGTSDNQEISLPVALHSPLEILREQLQDLTNIQIRDQILILCDLTDTERNSDVLLQGRDHLTLRQCGIKDGSYLTLHALGVNAEKTMKAKHFMSDEKEKEQTNENPTTLLSTPITAAQANHSYNGIIFDIESKGPFQIDIRSIFVGGMLGRVV